MPRDARTCSFASSVFSEELVAGLSEGLIGVEIYGQGGFVHN